MDAHPKSKVISATWNKFLQDPFGEIRKVSKSILKVAYGTVKYVSLITKSCAFMSTVLLTALLTTCFIVILIKRG